ncbi:MAG: tyrosine-type recombinase/integrase [Planctomycetaceae bacterium]|nr:tyrosine-type recombinase/integrase [Planctomycetaceae bacterium]
MASVFKRGGKSAPKGAVWMVSWFDVENERWATATGYPDKELSLAMGRRLENESAARREGWSDKIREHSLKSIAEPLAEYIQHLRVTGAKGSYLEQLEQRIQRLLTEAKVARLLDLDAPKIEAALLRLKTSRGFEKNIRLLSPTTRNEYATSICGFCTWAHSNQRIAHDMLAAVGRVDESNADAVHPRRALNVDELSAWLDAASRRPEIELLTVRTGVNKGKLLAKVRPALLERARALGCQRRHAYLVTIWTGLRRSELEALEWRDVFLEAEFPHIKLREAATKSRRGDHIALHPQVVEELLIHRPADAKPTDRVLKDVPSMKVLKADLKFAGIDYGNSNDGYADLHAQRKTLNTLLAANKVDSRTRQSQLRHTDPRLTENTYFDHQLFLAPQAEQINRVPSIPSMSSRYVTAKAADTEQNRAQLAHETPGSEGHLPSRPVTEQKAVGDVNGEWVTTENIVFSTENVTERHDPASCDTGSFGKRVKGVEPSTFTLAT